MTDQTPNPDDCFVIAADAVAEGEYREATVERDGRRNWLVLTRREGRVRAWLNVCPHAGRSLNWAPDKFLKDPDGNLVCAAHGAVFEPDDGQCIAGPCRGAALTSVAVDERDGEVHLAG